MTAGIANLNTRNLDEVKDGKDDAARSPAALRVLLIDENPERAAILEAGLKDSGYRSVALARPDDDIVERVRTEAPDLIIIETESPSRDTLESLRTITRERPRPIVMFVDNSDDRMIEEAIQAGVSAYVIDGLNARRVKPVLDVAIARFKEFQALRDELEKTKSSLNDRKVIERAKGLLMQRRKMSEEEAFRSLRKLAMDQNKRLAEVAQNLISYAELLKD